MLIKKKKEEKIKKKIKTEYSTQRVFVQRWDGQRKGPLRALSPASGGSAASTPRLNGLFFSFLPSFPSQCKGELFGAMVGLGVMEQDRGLVAFPWESSREAAASRRSNPPGWVSALFYIFGVNRLLPSCTRVRWCTVCPRCAVKVECLQEVSGGRRLPWVLLHFQDKRIILCSSLPEWMGDRKVLGDH